MKKSFIFQASILPAVSNSRGYLQNNNAKITLIFALLFGISGCIEFNQYELISTTITKIVVILIGTNLIDAMIIQPTIFSNTVKAHPLEIFLVVLMAGSLGGVIGMIVAIPTYTLLRIIAKEFFSNLKFFKKITENIPE